MTKFRKIHSLAFKQAKSVFLVSVLLGLCFSFYHTLSDLHQEQSKVQEHYNFKLVQSYENASQAAYHLNNLLAEQVATTLMLDPGIFKVEIVDDFGDVMTRKEKAISEQSQLVSVLASYLTPAVSVFSAELHQPNSNVVVGKLSFYIDGSSIAKVFIAKTTRVLLFDLLRNTLLTTILLLFFYQKLSRPITMLITWVNSLNDTQRSPLPLRLTHDDELSELASTFQSMWKGKELAESKLNQLAYYDSLTGLAKASGRNKFMFYEPEMQAQVESFLEIEKGLHEALNQRQLELFYQPQVDEQHNIIGVEALIRWNHPKRGLLPPGVFMPIAEETGQILPIGNWIIEQACYQYAQWKKQGILPPHFRRLAINISPLQFAQESFIEQVNHALRQAGITGEPIELEITESLLLENVESAIEKMAKLKESQISISIDDFGTGYSSLRYLKHLAVDVLKIDRSFVNQLHLDDNDQAIVDTILAIARKLNLEVIAEGVEDTSELAALKKLGCNQFQGYLFDKPLRAEEIAQRFVSNSYRKIQTLPVATNSLQK